MPHTLVLIGMQLLYIIGALGLAAYGLQALLLTILKIRADRMLKDSATLSRAPVTCNTLQDGSFWPTVTVQLPVFNELHVVSRLIDACAKLDYPSSRLQIQILDDSTDGTTAVAESRAAFWRRRGVNVQVQHRSDRNGFKAGALKEGMSAASGEFIAVFDADFAPPPDFLQHTVPTFLNEMGGKSDLFRPAGRT